MTWVNVAIDGGLDLVTARQVIQQGRLVDCLNYEIARLRGIRRIDGYEKFDGGGSPSSGGSDILLVTVQTSWPISPPNLSVGNVCFLSAFSTYPAVYGTIVGATLGANYPVISVKLSEALPYPLSILDTAVGLAFCDIYNPDNPSSFGSYNIVSWAGGYTAGGIPAPTGLTLTAVNSSSTRSSFLVPGSTYGYRLSATNAVGETFASDEQTVTTGTSVATLTTSGPITSTIVAIKINGATASVSAWAIPVVDSSLFTVSDATGTTTGPGVKISDGTNQSFGMVVKSEWPLGPTIMVAHSIYDTGNPLLIAAGSNVIINQYIEATWTDPAVPANVQPITGFNLYGRTALSELYIESVTASPAYDTGTLTPAGALPTENTTGSVYSQISDLYSTFTAISALVQQVPGQANVNGVFWLKDNLYATRDYLAVNYSAGSTEPNIGDTIYQGDSLAAATWSAQVAKIDIASGSWADTNDAAGAIMVYNEVGTYAAGALNNNTQSVSNFATGGTSGLNNATSTAAGLYLAKGGRGTTVATKSWQWCDLGWTVGYKSGANDFVDMNVALSIANDNTSQYVTTDWKVAGAAANGGGWNTGGGFDVAKIATPSDNLYDGWTFYTGSSKYPTSVVALTSFGFTTDDIPTTAAVIGVELEMIVGAIGYTGHYTAAPVETTIKLNGVTSGPTPNLASSTTYTVTGIVGSGTIPADSHASYVWTTKFWGAPTTVINTPTDLLGYTGITPADIVSSDFGVSIGYGLSGTQTNQEIQVGIDYLAIRVTYLPQTNYVYFWNVGATTPSAVKAQVVMHYQQGGSLSTSNATGTLYFHFIQSDGTVGGIPSRPIGSDEQIRTLPANGATPDGGSTDGSTLLAVTATAADMNAMDHSALLAGAPQPDGSTAPPSKYQSVTKNFYASAALEAIYGVSGGGPAFYFDGVKTDASGTTIPGNFSRILTGLPLRFETPRGIAAHQGKLVLTYYSGVMQAGNSENVLSFDPTLYDRTAFDLGIGEHVTGVASVNGDVLAIGGVATIYMLQGNLESPTTLYLSILSPTSGMVEYTLQPMANFVYCDFRGLTMLGTTQKYGDFEVGHISSIISPWIIPRVQLSSFFEGPSNGINNSVLIRNKNQYRAFFDDGYALSMTFLFDGENPQFTLSKYLASDGVTPMVWTVAQAFTERAGRDRIFVCANDNSGYVYEMDRGTSFNGAAISAYAILAQDFGGVPYQTKSFKGIVVYGQAQDYATFNLSRSNNYNVPSQGTSMNQITQTFGSASAAPTGTILPYAAVNTSLSIEGEALNLRFDSSSYEQFPHIIQAVSYTVDPMSTKQA